MLSLLEFSYHLSLINNQNYLTKGFLLRVVNEFRQKPQDLKLDWPHFLFSQTRGFSYL